MGQRAKTDKSFWEEMEPFKDSYDIPDIPVFDDSEKEFYRNVVIPNLIRCGAIPKADLEVGAFYIGDTRNTDVAMWNGRQFEYRRNKFGMSFTDTVNHFEDDDGYALFVPLKKVTGQTPEEE